jgi:hypothetical protein
MQSNWHALSMGSPTFAETADPQDMGTDAALDAFLVHGERHHAQLGTVLRLAHELRVERGSVAPRIYGAGRTA